MRDRKEKLIRGFGITAIVLAVSVIIPSLVLISNMTTGRGRDFQYGYSMYAIFLSMLGAVPALLSVIFGIISFAKYRKIRQALVSSSTEVIARLAMFMPILSVVLILVCLLLDTFVFP